MERRGSVEFVEEILEITRIEMIGMNSAQINNRILSRANSLGLRGYELLDLKDLSEAGGIKMAFVGKRFVGNQSESEEKDV